MLFFKGMKNRSNGFTLMEVLVCTTLLVSIIGLSSALLLTTSRYLERSRSHLMGEYVAEKVMEQVLSTDLRYQLSGHYRQIHHGDDPQGQKENLDVFVPTRHQRCLAPAKKCSHHYQQRFGRGGSL